MINIHKTSLITILCTLLYLTSCQETHNKKTPVKVHPFVAPIEKAHHKKVFLQQDAIQFDIDLSFGGKKRLEGTITTSTNSNKGMIKLKSGEEIYVDKDNVFCSEGLKGAKKVRFDAYTWTYFFLFPTKLSDKGTKWTDYTPKESADSFYTHQLSFEANTGDDPEDWYVVYADKETNLIHYAAYIVTANKTKEEAEKDPHAIKYTDYQSIEGIPIAHTWTFWGWRSEEGLTKQLGEGKISNVKFVKGFSEKFAIPDTYSEVK